MKKATFVLLALSTMFFPSCKKNNTLINGGSWTFKSVTYNTVACGLSYTAGTMTASNQTDSNSNTCGTLRFTFYNALPQIFNAPPNASGRYVVISPNSPTAPYNSLAVQATINGLAETGYQSTGGNGLDSVNVIVSNGRISVSGSCMMVCSTSPQNDSSVITFNVTQNQ